MGDQFLANYNVAILDIMPVHIGDYVMIGPNTLITTVNHPLTPKGRREHLGIGKPVTIGNDVWIGGNCTILPGVTIGNNVVIAAGAVVTHDVPDNCVMGGVPAKKIRDVENDIPKEKMTRPPLSRGCPPERISIRSHRSGASCESLLQIFCADRRDQSPLLQKGGHPCVTARMAPRPSFRPFSIIPTPITAKTHAA